MPELAWYATLTYFSMADTIITHTPRSSTADEGSAGWMVALVVILAVVIAGTFMYQRGYFSSNAPDATNINVTVPNPTTPAVTPTPTPAPVTP